MFGVEARRCVAVGRAFRQNGPLPNMASALTGSPLPHESQRVCVRQYGTEIGGGRGDGQVRDGTGYEYAYEARYRGPRMLLVLSQLRGRNLPASCQHFHRRLPLPPWLAISLPPPPRFRTPAIASLAFSFQLDLPPRCCPVLSFACTHTPHAMHAHRVLRTGLRTRRPTLLPLSLSTSHAPANRGRPSAHLSRSLSLSLIAPSPHPPSLKGLPPKPWTACCLILPASGLSPLLRALAVARLYCASHFFVRWQAVEWGLFAISQTRSRARHPVSCPCFPFPLHSVACLTAPSISPLPSPPLPTGRPAIFDGCQASAQHRRTAPARSTGTFSVAPA